MRADFELLSERTLPLTLKLEESRVADFTKVTLRSFQNQHYAAKPSILEGYVCFFRVIQKYVQRCGMRALAVTGAP